MDALDVASGRAGSDTVVNRVEASYPCAGRLRRASHDPDGGNDAHRAAVARSVDLFVRVGALLAALVAALAFGLWRRQRDGHVRAVRRGERLTAADLKPGRMGRRFTFVQFSSPACGPCRTARRVLASASDGADDVEHVELDVTDHLDLATRLHVRRTPTVVILDARGTVVSRIDGVPTAAELIALVGPGHEVKI